MKLILFFLAIQENTNNSQPPFLAYYALIGAGIGAVAALTAQYVSSLLTSEREKKKLKRELIAEERCLAYLLTEYHSILVEEMVLSVYYTKWAELYNHSYNDELYKDAKYSIQKATEMHEKIRVTTANYLKIITHFTNLTKKTKNIVELFNSLKNFKHSIINFDQSKDFLELDTAKKEEADKLSKIYQYFPNIYNQIHDEMNKSI